MMQTSECGSVDSRLRGNGVRSFRLAGSDWWTSDRVLRLAVCGLLLSAVGVVFGQTAGFDFVNYDDGGGVYGNRLVTGELTPRRLVAVFTEHHPESWAPLTCLSHLLVWHLCGHGPAAHHLTNVFLHAASAVLLFLVLQKMTDRIWPSALVAAVFAVHPLRAESVAWVTERKDVLSGFFFMLTLAAYLGYSRRPFSLVRYLAVLACFSASLAAKPMAVTLPLVVLLLDYWPLGRLNGTKPRSLIAPSPARSSIAPLWRLILEKVPLLAVAGLFCLLAVRGQPTAALDVNREYPFAWRIANAIISYVVYLGQFFCPVNLVPYYPRRPLSLPPWQVAAAILAMASITLAALWWRRQRPYLLVGWLWYVGMIFPVIGLVQFGAQAEADRFTYLPQIGLAIAIVWTWADGKRGAGALCREGPAAGAEAQPRSSYKRRLSPLSAYCFRGAAAVCVMLLVVSAWRQTRHWRDTEALWTHTVACSPENTLALNDLGVLLAERGAVDAAIAQYQRALEIRPDFPKAHNNLGDALVRRGRTDEAIQHYQRALETQPNFAEAHNNLGIALARRGRTNEAIAHFQQAVRAKPDLVDARYDLGVALQEHGEIDAAIAQLQKALELKPDFAEAHDSLGVALARRGRIGAAVAQFQKALEIKPELAEAHDNLGIVLAGCGRTSQAIAHLRMALAFKPELAEARRNLGIVLMNRGRTAPAPADWQKALRAAPELAKP
jgi:Flp pilus assembly protein TadD